MQLRKSQKIYTVTLLFDKGVTRMVTVKAASREAAERRALKRNRLALGVKSDNFDV